MSGGGGLGLGNPKRQTKEALPTHPKRAQGPIGSSAGDDPQVAGERTERQLGDLRDARNTHAHRLAQRRRICTPQTYTCVPRKLYVWNR